MPKLKSLASRAKKRFDHLWTRQQKYVPPAHKDKTLEKKQRAAWHANIVLALRERNAGIIQDAPRYAWISQHDEIKRLQAIKEILYVQPAL